MPIFCISCAFIRKDGLGLADSTISPMFVVRFGRSLRFCNLEIDKEAIYDVSWHILVF